QMLLPGLLTMLTDEPGLEVAVTDHDLDRPDWATLTPDFDIVLADSQGVPAHWSQGGLRVITLMTEPFDVAMPLGHRLADKAVLKPADLVDEPWVGAPVGYPYDRVLDGLAAYTGRAPRIVQRVMDNLIVERLVAAGIGLAILPRFTTRIHDTGIVTRPIAGIPAERQINALLRADRAERPSVRRILELLELEGRRVQSRYQHPAHRR
ncbi:MAG TPA: LysR substrate-binding domain-containing protein, partial [Microcella sp.]|nr:LysR substrate-binding domain-containing protein [Microcella sp.]